MITILDCAKLALHAYQPNALLFNKPHKKYTYSMATLLTAKNLNGWYVVNDVDNSMHPSNPLFIQLCIRYEWGKAQNAVIAVRGTDSIDNQMQDVKSWWKSFFNDKAIVNLPAHYNAQVSNFFFNSRRFTKKLGIPLIKHFITGHSLGGALAALASCYSLLPIRAVTFNAPGIRDIPDVKNHWHSVINFRSQYDFVSAIDWPIGPVWNLPVMNEQHLAARAFDIEREHKANGWSRLNIINDLTESADFLRSVLPQHSMANLLQALHHAPIAYNTFASYEKIITDDYHAPDSPYLPYVKKAA